MSRKGENIYKRKDGRWEGRYLKQTPDGKSHYGYVYAPTYREAKQRLRQAAVEWKHTPLRRTDEPRLSDAALRWEQSLEHRVKDSTRVKYNHILHSHLLPRLGDVALSDMTHKRIEEFSHDLLEHGGRDGTPLSPRTVSDVMSVLRNILRFAALDGTEIPCDGSTVRIRRERAEISVLTHSEQETLTSYLFNNVCPKNIGILLSLYCGLRIGEVCALRWEDIDPDMGELHVRRTMQRLRNLEGTGPRTRVVVTPPKSPSSLRSIPIPRKVAALMQELPEGRTGWFLTCTEARFIEPRCMQHHFRQVLQRAGLQPVNYHALRHTFATRCVELGFDVKTLSELLGHSTVSMTMDRYVHPTMAHKRSYMDRLTELMP